ncbi:MAG: tetratricopeptide repeat protein, partial [Myxococcales bacterium]|nr:tetratricopeptide repeat protein [Myxococcales bacterium]
FESMDTLLTELGRDRQRNRRRALAAVAALTLSLGSAAVAWRLGSADETPRCESTTPLLAQIWGAERRSALEASLHATGRSYADEVAPRVLAELDRYAEDWTAMQRDACERHVQSIESDATYDLRSTCLDVSKRALASTVSALEGIDAKHLPNAVELVEALPKLDACADLEALTTKVALPDPEVAAAVADERLVLVDLSTLRVAGKDQEALAGLGESLIRARALAYPPLIAEVLLALGRAQLDTNRFPEAAESLREGALLAFEVGLDVLGLEALARLINAESHLGAEQTRTSLAYLPFAEALSRRHPRADFARALLLNNTGTAHLAGGERERAKPLFREALALIEGAGLDQPELSFVPLNLASISDDPAERRALSQRAVGEFEAKLGAGHPKTLRARYLHTHNLDDAAEAERERTPICERLVREHPEERILSIECFYTLAYLRDELGDTRGAAAAFEQVLALAGDDPNTADLRAVAEGYAALERGELER